MRFVALFYAEPGSMDGMTAEDFRLLDDATIEHDYKLRASGNLLFASPLAGAETARVLRNRDGSLIATDGPYSETKEVVGGFLLLEAETMEAAVRLLADAPILKYGRMEVRPLVEHRHSQTGRARPDLKV